MPSPAAPADHARALVVLGLVALARAGCAALPPPPAEAFGTPVELSVAELRGPAFRLLPGVGVALAARLEQARLAAGGALDEASLRRVRGVGPTLLARWRALGALGGRRR